MKVIAAEGEHKASSALAQAAHVIEQSPHALQVSENVLIHILNYLYYSSDIYKLLTLYQPNITLQLYSPCLSTWLISNEKIPTGKEQSDQFSP